MVLWAYRHPQCRGLEEKPRPEVHKDAGSRCAHHICETTTTSMCRSISTFVARSYSVVFRVERLQLAMDEARERHRVFCEATDERFRIEATWLSRCELEARFRITRAWHASRTGLNDSAALAWLGLHERAARRRIALTWFQTVAEMETRLAVGCLALEQHEARVVLCSLEVERRRSLLEMAACSVARVTEAALFSDESKSRWQIAWRRNMWMAWRWILAVEVERRVELQVEESTERTFVAGLRARVTDDLNLASAAHLILNEERRARKQMLRQSADEYLAIRAECCVAATVVGEEIRRHQVQRAEATVRCAVASTAMVHMCGVVTEKQKRRQLICLETFVRRGLLEKMQSGTQAIVVDAENRSEMLLEEERDRVHVLNHEKIVRRRLYGRLGDLLSRSGALILALEATRRRGQYFREEVLRRRIMTIAWWGLLCRRREAARIEQELEGLRRGERREMTRLEAKSRHDICDAEQCVRLRVMYFSTLSAEDCIRRVWSRLECSWRCHLTWQLQSCVRESIASEESSARAHLVAAGRLRCDDITARLFSSFLRHEAQARRGLYETEALVIGRMQTFFRRERLYVAEYDTRLMLQRTMLDRLSYFGLEIVLLRFASSVAADRRALYSLERKERSPITERFVGRLKLFSMRATQVTESWRRIEVLGVMETERRQIRTRDLESRHAELLQECRRRLDFASNCSHQLFHCIRLAQIERIGVERDQEEVWQRMNQWCGEEISHWKRHEVVTDEERVRRSLHELRRLDLEELRRRCGAEWRVVRLDEEEESERSRLRAAELARRDRLVMSLSLLLRRQCAESALAAEMCSVRQFVTQLTEERQRADVEECRRAACFDLFDQFTQRRSAVLLMLRDKERRDLATQEGSRRSQLENEEGEHFRQLIFRRKQVEYVDQESVARGCVGATEDAQRRALCQVLSWQTRVDTMIHAAAAELENASTSVAKWFASFVGPMTEHHAKLRRDRFALEVQETEARGNIVSKQDELFHHVWTMTECALTTLRKRREQPFCDLAKRERQVREDIFVEMENSLQVLQLRKGELQRMSVQASSRHGGCFRIATQNLRHSAHWEDVATMMNHHNIDICILTEVYVKNDVALTLDANLASGSPVHVEAWPGPPVDHNHTVRGGVGVAIRLGRIKQSSVSCRQGIREDGKPSDRVIVVETTLDGIRFSFVGAYAPVESANDMASEAFYADLSATWSKAKGRRMLLGDLNARISSSFCHRPPNANGEKLIDFLHDNELCVGNFVFRKPWQRVWTVKSPFHFYGKTGKRTCLVNDYVLVTSRFRKDLRDVVVVQSGYNSDHKLVIAYVLPRKPKTCRRSADQGDGVQRATVFDLSSLDPDVERLCAEFQKRYDDTCKLPAKGLQKTEWASDEVILLSRKKAEVFRNLKATEAKGLATERLKQELTSLRRQQAKAVRRAWNVHWEKWAKQLEEFAAQNAQNQVYKMLRPLYRRRPVAHLKNKHDAEECAQFWNKLYSDQPDVPRTTTILPPAPPPNARPAQPGQSRNVTVFTDGGADNNGKPDCLATWGVHFPGGEYADRLGRAWGGPLSNNRGEICAAVIALETVEVGCNLQIKTDSKVLCSGIAAMRKNSEGDFCAVEHGDLFRTIYRLTKAKSITLTVTWIKGHSTQDGPDKAGNDAADKLCTQAKAPQYARDAICQRQEDTTPVPWDGMSGATPDEAELKQRLTELHNTASGMDKVQVAQIRQDPALQKVLFDLVRLSWERKVLPAAWRRQLIVAIPKKAGAVGWDQHRGIALLSHAGKLLARVILERMRGVSLLDIQHGFRRGHSTTLPILGLKNILDEGKRKGVPLVVTFVDVTKAYDWVSRNLLFETLAQHGVPGNVRTIIRSMYDDEIFMRLGSHVTEKPFKSKHGVRQGCLLSPLFFNLVLDRALRAAQARMRGLHVKVPATHGGELVDHKIDLQAYADDTMFVNASMTDAQHDLDVVSDAFAAAGFRLSVKKTQYIRLEDKRVKTVGAELPALPVLGPQDATGRRAGPWQYDCDTLWYEIPPEERAARRIVCPLGCGVCVETHGGLKQHLLSNVHRRVDVHILMEPPKSKTFCPKPIISAAGQHQCPHPDCLFHGGWARRDQYCTHWRKKHAGDDTARQWYIGSNLLETRTELVAATRRAQVYPVPPNEPNELRLYGEAIDRVKEFKYLGRVVDDNGSSHIDDAAVTENLTKARKTWAALVPRFTKSKVVRSATKVRVFKAVCQSQFVYGSESWVVGERLAAKMNSWQARCLRHCTGMQPKMVVLDGNAPQLRFPATADVLKKAGEDALDAQVQLQRIREVGRVLRRPADDSSRRWFLAQLDETGLPRRTEKSTLRGGTLALIVDRQLPADGGQSHHAWMKKASTMFCPTAAETKRKQLASSAKMRAAKKRAAALAAPIPARTL